MNIETFEEKYGKLGGFKLLQQFMSEAKTRQFIANHFGVGPERVSQWTFEIFGTRYDPRATRRERRLEFMLEVAPTMTESEWKEAFSYDRDRTEAQFILDRKNIKFKTKTK